MFVQHTDYLYCLGERLSIKNYVAAGIKFTVARTNFAAILALKRIGGKLMKAGIQY
jgi:hypothetical protein